MPETIFTTGLSGFIGKNLLPKLLNEYDQIINFERNNKLSIYEKSHKKSVSLSKKLINEFDAKKLIHLATLYRPNAKVEKPKLNISIAKYKNTGSTSKLIKK